VADHASPLRLAAGQPKVSGATLALSDRSHVTASVGNGPVPGLVARERDRHIRHGDHRFRYDNTDHHPADNGHGRLRHERQRRDVFGHRHRAAHPGTIGPPSGITANNSRLSTPTGQ
jgi:hypothetical protein